MQRHSSPRAESVPQASMLARGLAQHHQRMANHFATQLAPGSVRGSFRSALSGAQREHSAALYSAAAQQHAAAADELERVPKSRAQAAPLQDSPGLTAVPTHKRESTEHSRAVAPSELDARKAQASRLAASITHNPEVGAWYRDLAQRALEQRSERPLLEGLAQAGYQVTPNDIADAFRELQGRELSLWAARYGNVTLMDEQEYRTAPVLTITRRGGVMLDGFTVSGARLADGVLRWTPSEAMPVAGALAMATIEDELGLPQGKGFSGQLQMPDSTKLMYAGATSTFDPGVKVAYVNGSPEVE